MENGNKDFYNVAKMSAAFREMDKELMGTEDFRFDDKSYRVWKMRAMLAIAQQLTVISGHLAAIVGKAKEG